MIMIKEVKGLTMKRKSYSDELADEICDAIASSSSNLKDILKSDERFPCEHTFFKWLNKHEYLAQHYARAKKRQIEVYVNSLLEIARDKSDDIITQDDGKRTSNPSAVQRSRLQIDTIKWLASKLAPKIYGGNLLTEDISIGRIVDSELAKKKQELEDLYKKDC